MNPLRSILEATSYLRWKLFELQLELERRARVAGGTSRHSGKKTSQLRTLLRRTPYWSFGHLELARITLEENDSGTAFVAAQAVLALRPSPRLRRDASLLLGRVYLKQGQIADALRILTELVEANSRDVESKEDLAAAMLLAGDAAGAVKCLSEILPSELSPEGKATLNYAQTKAGL